MSLQIHHAPESGTMTIRWRFADERDPVLVGFVGADRKFRTSHPSFDAIDGATWGENLKATIVEGMKAA